MEEFNKKSRIIGIIGVIVLFFVIGGIKQCAQKNIRENAVNNAINEYNNR